MSKQMSRPGGAAWARRLLLALGLGGVTGCYKVTMVNPSVVAGEEHSRWSSFFLWGLAGTEVIDAHELCSTGQVARIVTGANVATSLVTGITLGLYSPRRVLITCAASQGAAAREIEIGLSEKGTPVYVARRTDGGNQFSIPEVMADRLGHYRVELEEASR